MFDPEADVGDSFAQFVERKTRAADAAHLPPHEALIDNVSAFDGLTAIGNSWTGRLFGGQFYEEHWRLHA